MRPYPLSTATLLAILAGAGAASAHAHLTSATPAPGSTVQAAPTAVTIDFTEGVEPQYSSILVQDGSNHTVSTGSAATAPGNNKRLSIGVSALPPGLYQVTWHATAIDTHKTEGTFQFTIKP